VDHIVFTGSDATGRRLAAQLGERLVSSSLELSGCDAMFVFEDADIDLAAKSAIFACTLNSGQTCLAARRVFVHTAVYSAFGQCLKSLIETVHPMEVALPQQKQQADRLVSAAVADGAQLFECRDESRSNENIPLRVVFDATPEMDICQEASFAPLTAVLPFSSVEAALAMEAKCRYGLGASIFTRDIQRAKQFAAQLRVGTVAINNVIVPTAHPATAVGGRGTSGWGVTQGREGLLEMTVPQTVSTQKSHLRMNLHMMAGTRLGSQDTILGLLQLSHSKRLLQRWRGLSRIVKALFKKDAAANRGQ
jgi:acyl-CoA reductase-like NAD-dependent aldehyde dehydrogenase